MRRLLPPVAVGVLTLALALPAGAQRRQKTVGGIAVVAKGREWPMAARIAVELYEKQSQLGWTTVIIDGSRPKTPRALGRELLKQIRKGREAMKGGKLQLALKLLGKAIRKTVKAIRKVGATPVLLRRIVQAHSYLGATFQLSGEAAYSRSAFTVALNIQPDRKLGTKYYPAEVIQNFERIKAEQRKYTGQLRIKTDGPAFVVVDGHLRGVAPTTISGLSPGSHIVEIRRLGYKRVTKIVDLDERLGASITAQIAPDPAQAKRRALLDRVNREMAKQKRAGSQVQALVAALGLDDLAICRATLDDGEISRIKGGAGRYTRRVRRLNAVPGQPPIDDIVAGLFGGGSRVLDLQEGTGTTGGGCEDSDDCSSGICVQGKCIASTPIYKKWWFWTLIGVAVVGVATGGALLGTLPPQPVIRFRTLR